MINGQTFFDQPVKNGLRTYNSIQKIAIGQGDDYTTGCLVDYNCFKNYYQMIAIDLSKQHALDVDSNAIQRADFTGNLKKNATTFFIIEEGKETVFDFSQGTVKAF